MQQALIVLQELTGIPAPKFQVPYGVALSAAYVNEAIAKITGRPPKAPLAGVRMAKYKMYFNPAKAVRELGFAPRALEVGLRQTLEYELNH